MAPPVIQARDLSARHGRASGVVAALNGLDFVVPAGQFVAVIGPSGAGKTTLMRCLTGFVRPCAGHLVVNGHDLVQANARQLRRLRQSVATVAQGYNLIERASALDNVLIGRLGHMRGWRRLLGLFPPADRTRALAALHDLGLPERVHQRVDRLSGGERQRVAIARALVQEPRIVLADEPAASLDIALTRLVLDALAARNRTHGLTVVVNLHDLDLARRYATRILALRRGRLVFDGAPAGLDTALERVIYDDETEEARAANRGCGGTVRPAPAPA